MNVQDRVNNAVPAKGYTLLPLWYRGVKVNEFDPNQPRGEDGRWTAAGEYAAKLDMYAAEYQTEGRVAEAAAATQAALLLRGHDYRASETVLREAELHRDIPNTHIAILRAADEAYIAKNYGVNWGMEAGTFTAWRAGAVTGTPRGVFFSIDKVGADAYGADGRDTHRYRVAIKNPLVIDRLEPAYAQLTGKSLDDVYAEKNRRDPMKWWRDTDAKIGRLAQAKGYDAIVYTHPAPPAIRELVVFDKKAITLADEPKANEQDKEGNEGRWVTMSGTPVFIKDGEDPKEAMSRTFKNKPSLDEAPKKEGALRKWLREKTAPLREAFEQGRTGAKPSPMQKAIPVTSKPAAVSGKIQRIREVGLGAKETVAELFYKRHVDEVFSGKVTAADKVDALMKKGVIKTGSEKPDVVRERAIRDFDKAVVLREQAAADRTESGEGKRAYTDKTLRAGLQKGETLAERYFPGHVDDLYNGTTSVTAKVDSMIEGGELGFGRGDKGFIKMRETAIKDFTRALNLREAADVREEKRKLEDAKPKKLTKREQQAEWTPSEDEVLASGPVVSSGTGWKRNMAENQPRDEDGKWTDGGAPAVVTDYLEDVTKPLARIDMEVERLDNDPTSGPGDKHYDALCHIGTVLDDAAHTNLSQKRLNRFAYSIKGKDVVAAGRLRMTDLRPGKLDRKEAEITNLGSVEKGEGAKVLKLLLQRAQEMDIQTVRLTSTARSFYEKQGFTFVNNNRMELDLSKFKANAFDPNQPRDENGKWTDRAAVFLNTVPVEVVAEGDPRLLQHKAAALYLFKERKIIGKEKALKGLVLRHEQGHALFAHVQPLQWESAFQNNATAALEFLETTTAKSHWGRYGKRNGTRPDDLRAYDWTEVAADLYMEQTLGRFADKPNLVSLMSAFLPVRPKANEFDPNQPRDTDGKWTGGTLSFKGEPEKVGAFTKDVAIRRSTVTGPDGKPVMTWHNPDGSQVTDKKLTARAELLAGTKATAPNYKGAWLNPNLESPLLAIAFDSKDRKHYVYSKEFEQGNAEEKFKIVAQMEKDLPAMRGQAAKDRSDGVPEAYLFKLEDLTCIRVGSDKDTGAETKAYGLTTLRGEHVKVEGDLIKLEFPAKGGDVGSYVVKDRELAAFITERKTANGDGELWPDVTAAKFNAYLKKLDPTPDSPVTAHKFRHYHATRLAEAVVAQYEGKTISPKEFKAVQREACEAAAAHLANTWSVCREKYVNPTVWGRLTVKAALKGNMAENQPRDEDGKWTDDGGGWSWRNNKSSPAEAFAASLSQEERDRIQNYYTAGTDEVNYPLREGRQLKGELEVTSKLLDKCFYDAPPLPKPITLYRVIPMAAATNWMEGVDERGNIRDAAYVSTTASEGAISRIQEDLDEETFVFEIKVPAGAKVLPLAELSGGHFGWQEEYLLPRNSKFHDNGDGTLSLVTVRRDGRLSTSV